MSARPPILFFGKLPGRGDFVRSSGHAALIQSLDRWLSSGIELLAEDAHWKQVYDRAGTAHFAMISAHRHTAIAGHLVPTADVSGRRFPFLTASQVEPESGAGFMALAPLVLWPVWRQLAAAAVSAVSASEAAAGDALATLAQTEQPEPVPLPQARQQYQQFLEQTSLGTLLRELADVGDPIDLRQTLLALGLLLQPLLVSAGQAVDKGLRLPLPRDPVSRPLVATFWMDLVTRFVGRTAHDLTLFQMSGEQPGGELLIGFSAGTASALHGLLDTRVTDSVFLRLNESAWVEPYVVEDYALKKLSSYLQMPQLSLAQVMNTFNEAFLGT